MGLRHWVSPWLTATAVVATLLPVVASASAGRADLLPVKVGAGTPYAVAGDQVDVSATVRNTGSGPAGRTRTAFLLSRDSDLDKGDVLLGRARTRALPAGGRHRVELSARIPGATKPAAYRVLACVDDATAVRESRESNNCRASRSRVTVTAPYDATPFGPVEPVSISPTVDESSTVSAPMTAAEGGLLELAIPDGTTFSLDVPAGALESDTTITMAAVTAVSGDPFGGGFVTGVRLGPDGLQLQEPAMLTVRPADPLAPDLETPFAAADDGTGFHLHPLLVEPTDPTFPLLHFTLVGLFQASDLQRTAQADRNAIEPQASLEQQIQAILSEARARSLLGGEGLTTAEIDRLATLLKRYYDVVARPLLVRAANIKSCAGLEERKRAVRTALLWARQSMLLGFEGFPGFEPRYDEMYRLIGIIGSSSCSFPASWSGTMDGTYEHGGIVESWAGSVTFTRVDVYEGYAEYRLSSEDLVWSISGTDEGGCSWSGSGAFDAFGTGSVTGDPDGYGFGMNTVGVVPVLRSCPEPQGDDTVQYEILRGTIWAFAVGGEYSGGDTSYESGDTVLTGTTTHPGSWDPESVVTYSWNLTAGS